MIKTTSKYVKLDVALPNLAVNSAKKTKTMLINVRTAL